MYRLETAGKLFGGLLKEHAFSLRVIGVEQTGYTTMCAQHFPLVSGISCRLAERLRIVCKEGLLLWLLLLPALLQAQLTFVTNNGAITITGCNSGGNLIIPSTTNGFPVTSIAEQAFYNQYIIWTVAIPASITNIGEAAFGMGQNLTALNVDPQSLFYSSSNGVLFNKDLTTLIQCPGAKSGDYSIPSGVTSIGVSAFVYCFKLTSVQIPSSITNIGDSAFNMCLNATALNVDPQCLFYSSVNGVLFDKNQMALIQYPGGIKSGSYTVPNTTTSIVRDAFSYCANLTNIILGNSITSIGNFAFAGSSALNNLSIPDSVTNLGIYAFYNCTRLTNVELGKGIITIGDWTFYNCAKLFSVVINGNVTSIGEGAFYQCSLLTSATIPESVTNIGDYAFQDCNGLTSVTIPNGVTRIGNSVFVSCSGLTNVTIPNSVTSIGRNVFGECYGLVTVTIPESVTNIGDYAFKYCTHMTGIFFGGNAPSLNYAVFQGDNATVYYLPGTTGWDTFNQNSGLSPAVLWNPQAQTGDGSFGIGTNGFGFNITGTTNIPIVVEAATNLTGTPWIALEDCTLTNGSVYFSDPQCSNYPDRFYRIRSP